MKTTAMASSALLLVLALALVSAPLTAEAKKKRPGAAGGETAAEKKAADSFCAVQCEMEKGPAFALCKDECALQQRANLVNYGRIQCRGKCTEQKGITKEGMKVCEEKCEVDYKKNAAVVTADCAKTCAKEKTPRKQESCKRKCTPPPS